MAKKSITPNITEPSGAQPAEAVGSKPARKKPAKAKASAETSAPKPAKTTKPRAKVKSAVVTKSGPAAASITPADIALRAYFIAEKRRKLGLPGDSTSDWVEAERQLKAGL